LPTNLWWQTMRLFFRRPDTDTKEKIREFAIASGISPNLCFKDIHEPRLFIVASDLIAGCPVIFGVDPNEKVLDCLLASIALPPWMTPMERDGQYLVDGGAVSNLPIEAALQLGATEIIALDLFDPNMVDSSARGLGPFFLRLDKTIEHRQIVLEMKLAEARGVHVRRLNLVGVPPVPLWDFSRSSELIERGYQLTHQAIASWKDVEINSWKTKAGWRDVLEGLIEVLE